MRRPAGSLVLAFALVAPAALAQPRTTAQAVPAPDARDGSGLLSHVGLAAARRLATSDVPSDRLRAVERFVTVGTKSAILALLEQLEGGSPLARDPDARLLAIRLLEPRASEEAVGRWLKRELLSASASRGESAGLLRATAAFALAKHATRENTDALLSALRQTGPAHDAAERALLAYPPSSLDAILFEVESDEDDEDEDKAQRDDEDEEDSDEELSPRSAKAKPGDPKKAKRGEESKSKDAKKPEKKRRRPLGPRVIELLGDLGDLRAVPALREELGRTQQATRMAAAIALAKFGDPAPIAVAVEWSKSTVTRQREVALEVLMRLDAPATDAAFAKLLDDPAARGRAIDLASSLLSPGRVIGAEKKLGAVLRELDDERAFSVLMMLARAGAASLAEKALADEKTAPRAAFALGTSGSDGAREALARALPAARPGRALRTITRGAIVHAAHGGEVVAGLKDTLARLASSKDGADRELAAFGLVALGERSAASFLGDGTVPVDVAAVSGAVRASLLRGERLDAFAGVFTSARSTEAPTLLQIAAGAALVDDAVRASVPRSALLSWAEEGGALGPLAAFAVGERNDDALAPRLAALLASPDPLVRVHAALGLANDPRPGAATRLARAYETEIDEDVRAACVRALSRRAEPQRLRALRFAASLDPSDHVRGLARAALRGGELPLFETSRAAVGWVTIVADVKAIVVGRVHQRGGPAWPTVVGPDGDLLAVISPASVIELDLRVFTAPAAAD